MAEFTEIVRKTGCVEVLTQDELSRQLKSPGGVKCVKLATNKKKGEKSAVKSVSRIIIERLRAIFGGDFHRCGASPSRSQVALRLELSTAGLVRQPAAGIQNKQKLRPNSRQRRNLSLVNLHCAGPGAC